MVAKNKNLSINNILVIIIIILIIYILLKNDRKRYVFEGLNFNHNHFSKIFPRYNFRYDNSKKELIHNDNQVLKCKELNSNNSRKIMNSKSNTISELEKYGIPVPKSIVFYNSTESFNELINKLKLKNIKFPVVVKPISGTQGKNVYVGLKNIFQLKNIINTKFKNIDEIQVQEEIEGNNFRILIVNYKIIDIIQRIKPYVVGNGKLTISELIEIRNKNQIKNKKPITYNILENYIEEQGFKMDDVVPINKKIFISKTINYHNGATYKRINISDIHPDNLEMFVKIMKIINGNISGIDYISKDISKSYKIQGSVIELNSGPYYQFHINKKKPLDSADKIVSQLDLYYNKKFGY